MTRFTFEARPRGHGGKGPAVGVVALTAVVFLFGDGAASCRRGGHGDRHCHRRHGRRLHCRHAPACWAGGCCAGNPVGWRGPRLPAWTARQPVRWSTRGGTPCSTSGTSNSPPLAARSSTPRHRRRAACAACCRPVPAAACPGSPRGGGAMSTLRERAANARYIARHPVKMARHGATSTRWHNWRISARDRQGAGSPPGRRDRRRDLPDTGGAEPDQPGARQPAP